MSFSKILYIILALLILLFMITVHEFGHYIVGKIFKFKINEFAIGMGPKIFRKQNKKTGEWFSIRALPLGGYCAFEGEDESSEVEGSFNSKEPYKRILVLLAGATMNLIFGILILMLSVGIYGQLMIETYDIVSDSVYQEYSLANDDIILKIEGKNIYMANNISTILDGKKKGDIVSVTVKDGKTNKEVVKQVKLRNDVKVDNISTNMTAFESLGIATIIRIDEVSSNSAFGKNWYFNKIIVSDSEVIRILTIQDLVNYLKTCNEGDTISLEMLNDERNTTLVDIIIPINLTDLDNDRVLNAIGVKSTTKLLKYSTAKVRVGFFDTIARGFEYSKNIAGTIFTTIGQLLTGKLGLNAVGGPITTIKVTANAISTGGFNYFLEIAGFIGINLAVFNLLPIPALDGSRVIFCLIEWIRKKPVNKNIEGAIHGIGLFLLLGFCVLVEILQLF